MAGQGENTKDLFEFSGTKPSLESLNCITSILSGFMVHMLCQLPGLMDGMLSSQVHTQLVHA